MIVRRPFFGWFVVLGAFFIAMFGWGLGFYGLAVYIAELPRLRGWSVAWLGAMATLYYLMGAALLSCYHHAVERVGQRTVTLTGVIAMAGGVLAVGSAHTRWHLAAAFLVMAVGWSTMSLTAVAAIVGPWFERRRGLAMSLALNGASCGGIVLAPALLWLTRIWGLQSALETIVLVMLAVLVPVALLVVGRTPRDLGLVPDGGAAPAAIEAVAAPPETARRGFLGSSRFWMVALPFALALLAQVGFLSHLVAFLGPLLGDAGAATALSLTTAMAVVGRLVLGVVVDRWQPRYTTAGCLLSQTLALGLMMLWPAPAVLFVACVIFGFSVGNLITLPALVVQREFYSADFVAAVGLIAAVSQVFYAFGPAILGALAELTGGYGAALAACMAAQLTAVMLLLLPASDSAIRRDGFDSHAAE